MESHDSSRHSLTLGAQLRHRKPDFSVTALTCTLYALYALYAYLLLTSATAVSTQHFWKSYPSISSQASKNEGEIISNTTNFLKPKFGTCCS